MAENQPQEESHQIALHCTEKMYADDKASQALGIRVNEVRPGFAKLSMSVREDMLNGHSNCHGGFIFALADSAFAFASNSHNQITVGQGCSIDYVRPASIDDELTATAKEQSRGRTTGLYDVKVTRGDGKPVAYFRGRSFTSGEQLFDPENT